MRLHELDAGTVALEVMGEVLDRARHLAARMGMGLSEPPPLVECPLYEDVVELVGYAQGLSPLSPHRSLYDRVNEVALLVDAKLTREPSTPIEAVLVGAQARYRLEHGQELSALELAILIGYNRDSVLSIAHSVPSARRLPDGSRPWRFKPTKALRTWMRDASERRAKTRHA